MIPDMVLAGSYNYGLVGLSILIAMLGSYATINLAGRVKAANGRARLYWQIGGATAMAIGTWAMHYTGMLAFRLPVPIQYDWPTSLLSFLPSLLASAIALIVVIRPKIDSSRAFVGGIFMGGGIAALHYTAMESMRSEAMHEYSYALVILSVLLAMVFSLLSIWLTFLFRDEPSGWKLRKAGSVALLGTAIWVMHYTGMASASFVKSDMPPDLSHAVSISILQALGIGAVAVMVLVAVLVTTVVDRLQEAKTLFYDLFEQAPQAVALMNADNRVVRINREFTRLFSYSSAEAEGRLIGELIVPDELRNEELEYADAVSQGQRVDAEGVRRRKDGSRLDVSIIRVPVSLPGGKIATYAIYSDIGEQKRAKQTLQEYEKALEGLDEMIIVVDENYRYLLANRAFLTNRGLEREQLIGRRISEGLNPGVFENIIKEKLDESFAGNVVKFEMKYEYPTLGERDLSISYFPIVGPTGDVRVVCVLNDITESKRAEEQLKATTEQLRALSARFESAKEEEGTRIAREIHDELGSALTSLRWDLEEINEAISQTGDEPQRKKLRDKIEAMIRLIDITIDTVQRIASELRPMGLDALGLIEAIEWQARQFQERTGIIVECDSALEHIDLEREQSIALFRIFQEALTNILRHAQASRVYIQMKEEDGTFILTIRDNGRGITEEEKSSTHTFGILGMQERAHLIGGKIDIDRFEGKGTVVTVRIPLAGQKSDNDKDFNSR